MTIVSIPKSAFVASDNRRSATLAIAAALTLILAGLGLALTDTRVDFESAKPLASLILMLGGLAAYCRFRQLGRLESVVETFLAFVVVNLGLLPISYLAVRFNMPLVDGWLMSLDNALGFDWPAFTHWVDGIPALAILLQAGYGSFGPQLMFLPVFLALIGSPARASAFVVAYILIVVVASVISIWFPAEGAFVGHAIDISALKNINAHFGYAFLEEFEAARTAPLFVISLDRVQGLLTFPSVHVAVAVLCLWAAWGSRLLILPCAALNIAMAASAISHGGHYLVDVPAGAAVAMVAIGMSTRLFVGASAIDARASETATIREIAIQLGVGPGNPQVTSSKASSRAAG